VNRDTFTWVVGYLTIIPWAIANLAALFIESVEIPWALNGAAGTIIAALFTGKILPFGGRNGHGPSGDRPSSGGAGERG
jgi:hypothetical protein